MTISSCETAKGIWDKLNVTYEEDKKHKAYVSWENEDDFSIISDKDEVANICLMENEDEVNDSNSTNNELQDAHDSLYEEFAKVAQEFSLIKKKNMAFQKEIEFLKNENKTLGELKLNSENESCKSCKEHEKLSLDKFEASSKSLDKILSSQKYANDREGVGYDINNPSSSKENKVARKLIKQPQAQKHASNFRRNKTKWQSPKHASYRSYDQNDCRQTIRQPQANMANK
ncbi:hypothetical protein PIB30_105946, partial [Stylosanthes scabra]|nr:hypothetical protein [Stylosanthes scabra]